MSDYVWVSSVMDNALIKLAVKNDISEADVQKSIEASRLNEDGKYVPQDLCPTRIWVDPNAPDHDRMRAGNLPDLFFANSFWIVSEPVADILRQFDLGDGALYPVTDGIFREDNVTRISGNFYTWIFGNSKSVFLPDATEKKDPIGISGLKWNLPFTMSDDNVAVSSSCREGPDVWLDGRLWGAIFFSRTLGDALIAAGLQKAISLYRARVI